MPRDGSGNYSRVVPPGASGYISGTTISSSQVNGEINDIGTELTNSITASGTKTPTANLPMGNFVHTGLGLADAAGETVRFNALQRGSDINIVASGSVTLPAEGALFSLTAASAFNITGFSNTYNGFSFALRSNPDKLLKLVNSASLLLVGGTDKIMAAGEILYFVQYTAGVYVEVGARQTLDLSSYSGVDLPLAIGQTAIYDISADTTLALRLLTATNQCYLIDCVFDWAAGVTVGSATLQLNNTNYGTNVVSNLRNDITDAGVAIGANSNSNNYILCNGGRAYEITARVNTRTASKHVWSFYRTATATAIVSGTFTDICTDTTTVITSLGTLNFGLSMTGRVTVTRLY